MPLLIALFSLVAAVWGVILAFRCRQPAAGIAVLVVGTLLGPPFFALQGPVQISLDRLLWVAMLGLFVVHRRMGQTDPKPWSRIDWAVVALAVVFALQTQRESPLDDLAKPMARWIFYILLPVGMYFVARGSRWQGRDLEVLTSVLIGLGIYLGATGVFEAAKVPALVFPRYISSPEHWEFLGRARGPLLNPAGNGIVIAVALTAAALRWIEAGRVGKALYGAALLVMLAGLYATMTRSVWIGGAASLGLIGLVYLPRWVRLWSLAAAVLLCGAMATGLKDQLMELKRDQELSAADAAKSVQLRPLLAVVAWEMFKDRPLLGHGYGHYLATAGPYHDARQWDLPLELARPYVQHNLLLSILVDTGAVGLLLLLGCVLGWAALAWALAGNEAADPQSRRLGLIMVAMIVNYLINGLFHEVSIIAMVHMYLFYLGGVTVGLAHRDGRLAEAHSVIACRG